MTETDRLSKQMLGSSPGHSQLFNVSCGSGRVWELKSCDIDAWVGEQFEQDIDIIFEKDGELLPLSLLELLYELLKIVNSYKAKDDKSIGRPPTPTYAMDYSSFPA